jgi:beta-glucosidase
VRRLAGFAVVRADAGQTVEVPVALSPDAVRHWDGGWVVEPGELVLSTGPSAGDQRCSTSVSIEGGTA